MMTQRKKNHSLCLIFILILISLSACQGELPVVTKATPLPTPESGKATITGRVVSTSGTAYAETAVRLAAVYREGDRGAFVLDMARSPGNYSDQNGYFVITNVEIQEFTVVVGDPETIYTVTADEEGNAATWTPKADEVLDIGTLTVELKASE